MANRIYTNHTLEEYNKKYRNRRYRLLKITKKEVEEFDKKNSTKIKGYLLSGRKWWLIGDTYYEIPKAPRFTWFRNLNVAVQVGCCLLGVGVIATAVTVPLVLLNQNNVEEPTITIKDATYDKEKSKINLNQDSYIVLKAKEGEKIVGVKSITVNGKSLKENDDYIFDKTTNKITIKAHAMTSLKIEIKVESKVKEYQISLDETSHTFKVDEEFTLSATITEKNSDEPTLNWEIKGESLQAVEINIIDNTHCKVIAKQTGNCKVAVSCTGGNTAECNIIVEPAEAKTATVDYSKISNTLSGKVDIATSGMYPSTKSISEDSSEIQLRYNNRTDIPLGKMVVIKNQSDVVIQKIGFRTFVVKSSTSITPNTIVFTFTNWSSIKSGDTLYIDVTDETPSENIALVCYSKLMSSIEKKGYKIEINSGLCTQNLTETSNKISISYQNTKAADLKLGLYNGSGTLIQNLGTYSFVDTKTIETTLELSPFTSWTSIKKGEVVYLDTIETTKEKFIRLAHEYIYGTNGFANSSKEYKKSDISEVYLYGKEVTDFTAKYTTDEYGRVFEISGNGWYYDFGSCEYYTDENLNSILRDEKVGHTTYTFTDDYISYTTDECKAEDGEEKSLTINKYGYVTKEIYYYTDYGGWCDNHVTLKNEPIDPSLKYLSVQNSLVLYNHNITNISITSEININNPTITINYDCTESNDQKLCIFYKDKEIQDLGTKSFTTDKKSITFNFEHFGEVKNGDTIVIGSKTASIGTTNSIYMAKGTSLDFSVLNQDNIHVEQNCVVVDDYDKNLITVTPIVAEYGTSYFRIQVSDSNVGTTTITYKFKYDSNLTCKMKLYIGEEISDGLHAISDDVAYGETDKYINVFYIKDNKGKEVTNQTTFKTKIEGDDRISVENNTGKITVKTQNSCKVLIIATYDGVEAETIVNVSGGIEMKAVSVAPDDEEVPEGLEILDLPKILYQGDDLVFNVKNNTANDITIDAVDLFDEDAEEEIYVSGQITFPANQTTPITIQKSDIDWENVTEADQCTLYLDIY